MLMHLHNNFVLASLRGLLPEIGLKSASCLVSSCMESFTRSSQLLLQRGAWPPLPAGCISLPHVLNLMRFSFDFSCPRGRGGGGGNFWGGKKPNKKRMLECDVILNSGSDELFKRQQQIPGLTELSNHPGAN